VSPRGGVTPQPEATAAEDDHLRTVGARVLRHRPRADGHVGICSAMQRAARPHARQSAAGRP
jgi:hypothetical protein